MRALKRGRVIVNIRARREVSIVTLMWGGWAKTSASKPQHGESGTM